MTRIESSVAEALGRAHEALLKDLQQLEEAVRPSAGANLPAVRARLEATQTHITAHFRFEEQNGYMNAVQDRAPHLERVIQQLAEEHHQLAQGLNALIDQARTAGGLTEMLRQGVRQWLERVRHHEERETDLVQEAFNQDIGAED